MRFFPWVRSAVNESANMKMVNGHACLVGHDDPALQALGLNQPNGALAAWHHHITPAWHTHMSERMMFYRTLRRTYSQTTELTVDFGKGACVERLCPWQSLPSQYSIARNSLLQRTCATIRQALTGA